MSNCPGFERKSHAFGCARCEGPAWTHDYVMVEGDKGLVPSRWAEPSVMAWVMAGRITRAEGMQMLGRQ